MDIAMAIPRQMTTVAKGVKTIEKINHVTENIYYFGTSIIKREREISLFQITISLADIVKFSFKLVFLSLNVTIFSENWLFKFL